MVWFGVESRLALAAVSRPRPALAHDGEVVRAMLWFEVESRLALAAVFGLSSFSKMRSAAAFAAFKEAVARLGAVPSRPLAAVSRALVAAEAAVAVALLADPTALIALMLVPVLLGAFTVALVRVIRANEVVVCACFGPGDRQVSTRHVVRNLALLTIAVVALAVRLTRPAGLADVSAGGLLVCALGAIVAAGTVVLWDDLTELFGPGPTSTSHADLAASPRDRRNRFPWLS